MKKPPVVQIWLSLEQASQALGLPWFTVFRWARSGDPRLPAYKIWDQTSPRLGRYRFKEQDVEALQAQEPAPLAALDPAALNLAASLLPGGPKPRRQRRSRLLASDAGAEGQPELAA